MANTKSQNKRQAAVRDIITEAKTLWGKNKTSSILFLEQATDPETGVFRNEGGVLNLLSKNLSSLQRHDQAIAVAQSSCAVARKGKYGARSFFTLGQAYFQAGQYEQAIAPALEAHTREPQDLISATSLASIYLAAGQYENAITISKRAQEIDPNDQRAASIIATSYLWNADLSSFREIAGTLTDDTGRSLLAKGLFVLGQFDEAKQALLPLIQRKKFDPRDMVLYIAIAEENPAVKKDPLTSIYTESNIRSGVQNLIGWRHDVRKRAGLEP